MSSFSFPSLLTAAISFAAISASGGADPSGETERGDRQLAAYLRHQAKQIGDACLADLATREDWEKRRPERRRQFLDMVGVWPMPARTDLHATVTGRTEADEFVVEKLHFQSRPGLYVTANLYVPKKGSFPAPTILYLCGHANTVIDKVSYGSKVSYQHHAAWFASHGYVCLILDTLQLGEIPGIHHGTYQYGMWWWQTLDYTPAGVECWNAVRALDYLETRPEVDRNRIGVTGRSGGGAYSWWVAAADDRPKCFVPVAGIADVQAQVSEGLTPQLRQGIITGHCDCMFFVNTYRWDFAQVVALCAPRPLLLGNSDRDDIFPVPAYRRVADKVRKVYQLYGAADRFQLLETKGPHSDTPELRLGAYRWFNRWLKNESGDVTEPKRTPLDAKRLKVFERLPDDALNQTIQESFILPTTEEIPSAPAVAREWWAGRSKELLAALRERVFRGWSNHPPALNARLAAEIKYGGLRLRAYDFTSEDEIDLRLCVVTAEKSPVLKTVVLTAVDEPGWSDFVRAVGPPFREALLIRKDFPYDEAKFRQQLKSLEQNSAALVVVAPRGIGPTRWDPAPFGGDVQVRRRFPLLGQTLNAQQVWDVRRALAVLDAVSDLKAVPRTVRGQGDMAGVVLYAGLFEPSVARFDLWSLPASHRTGPILLNVRRVLDLPQAVALAFPRPVQIHVDKESDAKPWEWPLRLQKELGQTCLQVRRSENGP